MNLKLNGNGNGQSRPYLRIALLAVAVLLVGWLVYRQIDRLMGERRTVWVAASDLGEGEVVARDDLEEKRVAESRVPRGAIANAAAAVGRALSRQKPAGATLVAADFAPTNGDPRSIAGMVPAGRVLMTLRVSDRALPFPELRRGDRLDLLAVGGGGRGGSVASDVYFLGWIRPAGDDGDEEKDTIFGIDLTPPGRTPVESTISLLLAVRPEDVFRLARVEALRAPVSVVLHGQTEVDDGRLLELAPPGGVKVELIAGARRESVALQP